LQRKADAGVDVQTLDNGHVGWCGELGVKNFLHELPRRSLLKNVPAIVTDELQGANIKSFDCNLVGPNRSAGNQSQKIFEIVGLKPEWHCWLKTVKVSSLDGFDL
jgi:hypothetical protein